ncbi:POZ-, AT hook-, and zinc finger-containing protein 1 isoform X1 [Corythoichthys intestinalis]|uniref:POZ-, AT hook-, and zinc finger-containing protein 1 isoform X1 n=1 Tax=Corythoichthys intestinalis TaxID=161448 RepID=UPI0025A5EDBA|nr:POZ-, AT hook-, and zinc finger-containing protein 1 isoform X1 [Corythoichthys intestinalis]
MEKLSEPSWTSSYTYQVSKHSAEMLHNLDVQRKDGGRFCDVILRVGEESFPAHKAVLAACSEYFESMFGRQPEDGDARELEMHTISPKVFKDILDFAYTSRIVVRLECFPELMTAAKFLLMRSVIEICQEVIKQSNVQILVPSSRGANASLFQAAGSAELGFSVAQQQDLVNGTALVGFANNGHQVDGSEAAAAAAVLLEDAAEGSMPILQPVQGLPMSPETTTLHHDAVSKRGRGRPKKAGAPEEPLHFNHNAQKNIVLFPCGACGKAFTEASRLKNHEAQHGATIGGRSTQSGMALLAQENDDQFHGGLGMDNGRKRERTRRHVGCDICGKVFRDVYHLNRHKLSHSGEKPYACHVCGLRFKRKDRMSYHVRSHDGSVGKPYVCQSCGKGFSRPDHLNGHIKQVHTTERPHKCQICNASFATRDRLRSHLACHEDKIPCKVCGKFLRAAYMSDHLKKHSEGTHNYCGICNKGFSTASYLKVHTKTHHGSSLPPSSALHPFPETSGELQMHNGAPYHMGRQFSVEDASRQLVLSSPEAGARFHGLPGHQVLSQPGPPDLGSQPEQLLVGKPGGTPYFWECRSGGVPAFPVHGPAADGQENDGKCPHLESEESDPSFGELSNCDEMKSPPKSDRPELELPSLACNGTSVRALGSPEGPKAKTEPEKKFNCGICGQAFRTKSYLRKHQHRVHKTPRAQAGSGSGLSELAPFSPQQSMSLLESFGFQIVQSAFASSLVDADAGQSGLDFGGK